jgi:predicted regulator of Ras-like GTPase activity (Roadblock/LC7/MglB family)
MDDKDKSIIDKILKISGVEACAISSLDGEVLRFDSKDENITPEAINKISSEISKLFASYSISSIDIQSLYLNFQEQNIIVNGFGSGFIFIVSQKNSNVNLLKMETSYLESEFIKIVNQSIESFSSTTLTDIHEKRVSSQDEDIFGSLLGETKWGETKTLKIVPIDKLNAIKDIFSSSLGPISAMLFDEKVKELNEDFNNFNVENIQNLINRLAEEIEGKTDKLDFIKNAKRVI